MKKLLELLELQTIKIAKVAEWIILLLVGGSVAIMAGGIILVTADRFGYSTPKSRYIKAALIAIAKECAAAEAQGNPYYPATELAEIKTWNDWGTSTRKYKLIDLETGLEVPPGKPCMEINYSAVPKDGRFSVFNMDLKNARATVYKTPWDLTCIRGANSGCFNGKWELYK